MIENVSGNGMRVSKTFNAKLVSWKLSLDTLVDVKRTDYVLMEPVIVNSHVKSFAHIIVTDTPEVLKNIEIVTSEVVCGIICNDEELILNMVSDDKHLFVLVVLRKMMKHVLL